MKDDNLAYGLSYANRNFIVGIAFVALLLLGPVQPYGMTIRLIYLTTIPAFFWLALRYVGDKLELTSIDNDRLSRAITAAIAGVFLVIA